MSLLTPAVVDRVILAAGMGSAGVEGSDDGGLTESLASSRLQPVEKNVVDSSAQRVKHLSNASAVTSMACVLLDNPCGNRSTARNPTRKCDSVLDSATKSM